MANRKQPYSSRLFVYLLIGFGALGAFCCVPQYTEPYVEKKSRKEAAAIRAGKRQAHITSTYSTQSMGNRGDRCFYGGLISVLVSFLCFSIWTGHSGDNPLHDFESKPKKSKGQDK
ncbi:hypothetical protein MBLNU13_g02085t1 [Cladosporium sp. NU13]